MALATYIQKGSTMEWVNNTGTDVAAWEIVLLGGRIAVAGDAIANGASGNLFMEGVFSAPAVNDTAFAAGDQLYWDAAAEKLTKVATGNTPAGTCFATKAETGTTAWVNISGGGCVSNDAATNPLTFRGVIDCAANPNYPKADAGDVYIVSVAGKIGGAAGPHVEAGDLLVCKSDGTAAGTHAAKGSAWGIVQANLHQAVLGAADGYKVAHGVTTVTGTAEVTTGLATVVSIVAMLAEDPSANATSVSATIPTQEGDDAGKATLKVWKPTAADNSTPTAADTAKNVSWIAFGT